MFDEIKDIGSEASEMDFTELPLGCDMMLVRMEGGYRPNRRRY